MSAPPSVLRNFDANATAPVSSAAREAYEQAARLDRSDDQAHEAAWKLARSQAARALGAAAEEVFFTAGGTEADQLALLLAASLSPGPPAVGVLSPLEHSAVTDFAREAQARGGLVCSQWPVSPRGQVVPSPGATVLAPGLGFVSVLLAHNETGVVQPIARVAAAGRSCGAWVHTDAVQAVGRLDIDFCRLGVDMLALAGHKVGAVGGVGALLVRRGTALHARLRALLAGTWRPPASADWLLATLLAHGLLLQEAQANLAGIASLGAALAHLPDAAARQKLGAARDGFEARLQQALGRPACRVLGEGAPRLVNTSALHLVGIEAEAVLMGLDMAGFAISAGAACASGALTPSPSLRAMGLDAQAAREVVRISLPTDFDAASLSALGAALVAMVQRMGRPKA